MKRKVGLFLMMGAMLPLGIASTAWACANLARVTVSKSLAAPGDALTVTGSGFSGHGSGTNVGDSDVRVTLSGRKGTFLGMASVSSAGRISETMTLPRSVSPGWYTVMATQYGANGVPKPGTPGRTRMRVQGASSSGAVVSPWGSSKPTGPAGSSFSVAGDGGPGGQTLVLGMGLALTLLAGGSVLVGRRNRTTSRTLGV